LHFFAYDASFYIANSSFEPIDLKRGLIMTVIPNTATNRQIVSIGPNEWVPELEKSSLRYHRTVLWIAIIFDPLFAITDYINIDEGWEKLLFLRFIVSGTTLILLITRQQTRMSLRFLTVLTFLMISLQNAYTYSLINNNNLLGHNLNYMALLVGAAMFILWEWYYTIAIISISAIFSAYFIGTNPNLDIRQFFLDGGLLLAVAAVFMGLLIRTRFSLTVREIKARLALQVSNREIERINGNLEALVKKRTAELETKNAALEEAAFINAHKLRAPVASILGLANLLKRELVSEDGKTLLHHLESSTQKLDEIVTQINITLEKSDRKG
jgi:signal transduction histidine kinase